MARRSRRWGRLLLLVTGGPLLVLLVVVGVAYASTEIPEPSSDATATAVRILHADGSELGRVGAQNRIPVSIDAVPEHVQHAVLAAEDRGFYREPGISPRGIARALLTNVRNGGSIRQGGSTITQQYAKNAFLTSERTYSRKVREVFIALKMSRTLEKDEILEDYLNTIYWGRQSAGIGVAARSYFGTDDVSTLTVAQGAVLAATIRSPARLDPAEDPDAARARWEYVLDGMVSEGWLTAEERDAQVYPAVLAPGEGPRNNDLSGPKGHVVRQVLAELARLGFDEARLYTGGLVVQTTIRRAAQEAAVAAVQSATGAAPGADGLQGALVSVRPETGEVWAYYGGATGTGFDFALNGGAGRQPGSTFKPYVLAAALEEGMSLRTRLDGDSGTVFPGASAPVDNFGGRSYGRVDLVEATQRSVNTAYFQLGLEVGPQEVAELAHAAGIREESPLANPDGTVEGGISLGTYEVQVLDQAVGYATFANGGVPVRPYLVQRVSSQDRVVFEAEVEQVDPAFSPQTAADATWAMQQVVESGTGRGAQLAGGREAAGKTGTSSDNRDAWFVGFTPELATAVWLGHADPRTIRVDGVEVTGGGLSSGIWKSYTDAALDGQPLRELPEPVFAGTRERIGSGGGSGERRSTAPPVRRRSTSAPEPEPEPSPSAVEEPVPTVTAEPAPPDGPAAPTSVPAPPPVTSEPVAPAPPAAPAPVAPEPAPPDAAPPAPAPSPAA